jgi:hypothetical protein
MALDQAGKAWTESNRALSRDQPCLFSINQEWRHFRDQKVRHFTLLSAFLYVDVSFMV